MASSHETKKRELTLVRMLNAQRELVWEAWTAPQHIASWWGPKGMQTKVTKHDFKPGGSWAYIMIAPNGSAHPASGTFVEIVAPSKIVTTAESSVVTTGVVLTVLFEDLKEKTKLTLTVLHVSETYRKQQEDMGVMNGWGAAIDSLEAYLTTM